MPDDLGEHLAEEGQGTKGRNGLTVADILGLPEPARGLLSWLLREGSADLPAIAGFLHQDQSSALAFLSKLEAQGYVRAEEQDGRTRYRAQLAPKRKGRTGIDWPSFGD